MRQHARVGSTSSFDSRVAGLSVSRKNYLARRSVDVPCWHVLHRMVCVYILKRLRILKAAMIDHARPLLASRRLNSPRRAAWPGPVSPACGRGRCRATGEGPSGPGDGLEGPAQPYRCRCEPRRTGGSATTRSWRIQSAARGMSASQSRANLLVLPSMVAGLLGQTNGARSPRRLPDRRPMAGRCNASPRPARGQGGWRDLCRLREITRRAPCRGGRRRSHCHRRGRRPGRRAAAGRACP